MCLLTENLCVCVCVGGGGGGGGGEKISTFPKQKALQSRNFWKLTWEIWYVVRDFITD